ncbi:DUF6944 family repetitive protein [Evansella tamaricis]|uniref:Uncharacterized protein n=1 Tax=Evansella tamaricis TaxID=2069301 RepID=A0ABS6JAT5_9BACI|nr:hypothetical protein [Evansella tamaricis]MBU9710755.1 hypothetical protein [Evansella tamaricis]
MSTDIRDLAGNWIGAIGTTIGAIGQTEVLAGRHVIGQHLWIIGKGIQGVGAAIQAVAEEEKPFAELGNWFISAGSSTVSALGVKDLPNAYKKEIKEATRQNDKKEQEKTKEDQENLQVIIIGNALQSIGAYIVGTEREHPKRRIGGIVQSLGALIEGIGNLYELSSEEKIAQQLAVVGAWLQSFGTTLQAVGTTDEYWEDSAT